MIRTFRSLALLALSGLPLAAQTGLENGNLVDVALGGNGFDMAVDDSRALIYVSVPTANEVVAISALSFQVVGTMSPGNNPRGIDISGDGSTLYVALNGAGSVAVVDLGTFTLADTINIGTLLDHPTTWDVAEGMPGEVFVSANPSSGGFAYIVRIDRNNGNSAARVASNRIIRAGPTLRVSTDRQAMYVGEGFSPNSLYKLDITQPSAPIVLEDNHGSVSGTQHTALTPTGDAVFLSSGQVLNTASFNQLGSIASGRSAISRSGLYAFVVPTTFSTGPDRIEVFGTTSLSLQQTIPLPCPASSVATVAVLEQDRGVLALADDRVCGRVLPGGTLCSLTGSGEDLQLLSQNNVLNCKEVDVADQITATVLSPNGGYIGSVPVLGLQVHNAANPPVLPPLPDILLDLSSPNLIVVTQYFGGGPVGPFTLPPQGTTYTFQLSPVLALYTLRLQAIGLSLSANNGMYAATDAHDLALVSGDAPTIHSVHPVSAVPGESITILGESFDPGVEVRISGEVCVPSVRTDDTIVVTAPAAMACNTELRLKNDGGKTTTVPFNPEPVVTGTANATGPAAGGTPFVVLGTGFVGGLVATVDGLPATILGSTGSSVTIEMPAHAPGQAQVELTASNGCVVTAAFVYQ